MKSLLQLLAVLGTITSTTLAYAEPTAFYDRNSGQVFLQNDTTERIFYFLTSDSGRLVGPPIEPNDVEADYNDLPFLITYFGVAPTTTDQPPTLGTLHDVGIVVAGGGPVGDLELRTLFLIGTNVLEPGRVIEIPEPSTIAAAVTLLGLLHHLGLTRKQRAASAKNHSDSSGPPAGAVASSITPITGCDAIQIRIPM